MYNSSPSNVADARYLPQNTLQLYQNLKLICCCMILTLEEKSIKCSISETYLLKKECHSFCYKIFHHLHSNILAIQENTMLCKSALRKSLLMHFILSKNF